MAFNRNFKSQKTIGYYFQNLGCDVEGDGTAT